MPAKRIIPCLDVLDGRVVKGICFQNLRDLGSPAAHARRYDAQGADELVFLDIGATQEGRATREAWVEEVARNLSIPFTVGGGVATLDGIRQLLRAGADKVALNSAAVARPELVQEAAEAFGAQCVVVAVDAARDPELGWRVFIHGGRSPTNRSAVAWIWELEALGAGEILLTSIDRDGTGEGFDLELLAAVSTLQVPLIASGGAGQARHFLEALGAGADAVLAATLFHEGILPIPELRAYLNEHDIPVRKFP